VAFSQGIAFFHAGDDILRSKSLDRDSYNSGALPSSLHAGPICADFASELSRIYILSGANAASQATGSTSWTSATRATTSGWACRRPPRTRRPGP
jgi:hypothetical protein